MSDFVWLSNLLRNIDGIILAPGNLTPQEIQALSDLSDEITVLKPLVLADATSESVNELQALAPNIKEATKKLEETIAAIQSTNNTLNNIASLLPTLSSLATKIISAGSGGGISLTEIGSILGEFSSL